MWSDSCGTPDWFPKPEPEPEPLLGLTSCLISGHRGVIFNIHGSFLGG